MGRNLDANTAGTETSSVTTSINVDSSNEIEHLIETAGFAVFHSQGPGNPSYSVFVKRQAPSWLHNSQQYQHQHQQAPHEQHQHQHQHHHQQVPQEQQNKTHDQHQDQHQHQQQSNVLHEKEEQLWAAAAEAVIAFDQQHAPPARVAFAALPAVAVPVLKRVFGAAGYKVLYDEPCHR